MADITTILEDLAAGRIDAAEAARQIDAAEAADAEPGSTSSTPPGESAAGGSRSRSSKTTEAPSAGSAKNPVADKPVEPVEPDPVEPDPVQIEEVLVVEEVAAPAASHQRESFGAGNAGVHRVVVRSVGRRVRLIGDASVAAVAPSGPHVLRRTGSTIEVTSDGDIGPSLDGFSLIRPPRSLDDLRTMGLGKELVLRINPAIAVDVEVTAGSLTASRIPVFGKVRVTAGGANLSDVVEVSDALVQAGSATIEGPISQGRSRVRVESGSLTVRLTAGANVAIRAETNLARVSWPGEQTGQIDEYVVGNGAARLDIGAVMGHASVRVDEEAS